MRDLLTQNLTKDGMVWNLCVCVSISLLDAYGHARQITENMGNEKPEICFS